MKIRILSQEDIPAIEKIYEQCFPREKFHRLWLQGNIQAFPRIVYYVAELEGEIVGYAEWSVKSGFREKSIVELEQLAVLPDFSGKGIGRNLLEESYSLYTQHLSEFNVGIKAIYMTTRDGNFAENLYIKVFGVERHGVIKGYGSGDEVILFKRFE